MGGAGIMGPREFIEKHEGRRKRPYKDTKGILTIGVGVNLSQGLTDPEIDALFTIKLNTAREDAENWLGTDVFASLTPARRTVVMSMAFQFGRSRLGKFVKTRGAIIERDYDLAAAEMLNSRWARSDSPARAQNHARIMQKGVF